MTLTSEKLHSEVTYPQNLQAVDERLQWKATKPRQFLLFTEPVVLRDMLTTEEFYAAVSEYMYSVKSNILFAVEYFCKDATHIIC